MAKGQRDDHPGTAWSASGEGRIVIGHKESGEPIFRYLSTKMQKELLKKQCGGLPKEEGDLLRQILSGKKPAGVEGEALSLQVERNRALLERTLQADKALSRRLAGRESFYQS